MEAEKKTETGSFRDPVSRRYYRTGLAVHGISGLCSIAPGIVVSILQDHYGLSYGLMGTMVSGMSIGNMIAVYVSGMLPSRIGERRTTLFLGIGFFLGYLLMSFTGIPALLLFSFFLAGIARGTCQNKCTVLVGNYSEDRTAAVALQNAFFAVGALLCPFMIGLFGAAGKVLKTGFLMETMGLSAAGLAAWGLFVRAGLPKGSFAGAQMEKEDSNAFLKDPVFWLLTLMLFCSMGIENSVNGWLVSYYKTENILSGTLSTYTTTIQWLAILVSRLAVAFVIRPKDLYRAIAVMSAAVTCMILAMVSVQTAGPAILALTLYSMAVGGVFPTAVAGLGKRMNSRTIGVMLSTASTSAVFFPWLIGMVADRLGLRAGMRVILVPCAGVLAISLFMYLHEKKRRA